MNTLKKIAKSLLILLLSINANTSELYVTGESIQSSVSNLMKDIDENIKFAMSVKEVDGSRDEFTIKGLKVYDSGLGEVTYFNVESISCSGYKINDYDFNTSITKYFKMPIFEDVNQALKKPSSCSIKGISMPILKNLLENYDNQMRLQDSSNSDESQEISTDLLKSYIDIFQNINIQYYAGFNENGYQGEMVLDLSNRIYFKSNISYTLEANKIYTFFDSLIKNVVFKYWGYKSYEDLYKDTSGDTSDIFLDVMAELEFQPQNFYEYIPKPLPEVLLREFTFGIAWTKEEYNLLKKNNPQIEASVMALGFLSAQKLDKQQFIEMIGNSIPIPLSDDIGSNLYTSYVSAMNATQKFSKNPKGMEISSKFKDGINIVPNFDDLVSISSSNVEGDVSPDISTIMMIQAMEDIINAQIVFKANPEIK